MRYRRLLLVAMIGLAVAAAAAPAAAVDAPEPAAEPTGLTVTSPYASVAVAPGDSTSFTLNVGAPFGTRVALAVGGLPEGWSAELTGGGFVVDEVIVTELETPEVSLDVTVPADAAPGDHRITVEATGGGDAVTLELGVRVAEAVGGGVTLETEFPQLRGASDDLFSYTVTLRNDTPGEIQFGLEAAAPPGWQLEARPSGESQASTVTVGAAESTTITLEADPPDDTPAGVYPLGLRAAGGGESATIDLAAEITGNFAMVLGTADQRLNIDVVAGRTSELPLTVTNNGTAPLVDVAVVATAPAGWTVEVSPERIEAIQPGESASASATITPASDAITGDYIVTLTADTAELSQSIDVRTTVQTSALWGAVGIGVIVLAIVGLALVFRRYGRR